MQFAEAVYRVRRAARIVFLSVALGNAAVSSGVIAANVTLAWDPSSDPTVIGYRIYYGLAAGTYTNMVDVGAATSVTVSNLVPGATYQFAATTYNLAGLESAYSTEISYTVPALPVNQPPTLSPIADVTINENAGTQTVNLTGITSGSSNEVQVLVISAFSSNPALVPNPTLNYTSPNTTGTLSFAPTTNSFGYVVMTVMLDDGGTISNTIIRTFGVTVTAPSPLTNAVVVPNTLFRFTLTPPVTNNDRFAYSLGAGAPAGAGIVSSKKTGTFVAWVPNNSQASTTNLITIVITDLSNPALSTNETVLVVVQDYFGVGVGSTSVQAGQGAVVPIYLNCSDGTTNAVFTIGWPGNNFLNPVLTNLAPGVAASSLQNQGTNLMVALQTTPGQTLQGTNLIAQLSFQTISNQPSAFVNLPVAITAANKPDGTGYANYFPQAGRVAVVSDVPLLQISQSQGSNLTLILFGKVGARYQLQCATNLLGQVSWSPLNTYNQTTVAQTVSVNATSPVLMYRLQQR
ncbi:MAG TPA: fibronectin type III domain-containing protein [Candidatus Acidoferrum sp.]|jgi:hypothetical protein|nr:fibronectin type III domain-containing protein [Candidatus Acidoferrum sp.]